MVRASFTAKVTSTGGSASNGFSVDLESTARNSAGEACAAQLDGLSELKVTKNQTVNRGEVIGKQGNGGNMSFAVQCSDELDGKGRPALSVSPTPPAPPAPVAPVHQVAPAAPPSPPSSVTAVAPVAPPAPTSWGTAPAPPSPPSPAPAASPGPAPLAAPSPAPHVHPTPATPVVPPTPKTPTAYKPTNQNTQGGIVLIRQESNKATFKLQGETKPVLEQQSAITSPFGYTTNPFSKEVALHTGVDLRGSVGLAIHAPAGAKVAFAGEKGSNGNVVELDLGDGVGMRFAHLDKIDVAEGGRVKAGDAIGTIGVTGLTTGPHVHVEIYKDGKAVDPETVENLTLSAD
jgi:murein DD-endopeptidase MepM/ murein hydrolase activator NlpD